MYSYIVGKVDSYGDGYVVVETAGIGYLIYVSNSTLARLSKTGETVKIYLHLVVREDEMSLFGFYSLEEKRMFLRLITVSGVGPKMALGILSSAELSTLTTSIVSGDIKTLSKVKGIGKKTAERIVVELKEGLNDDDVKMAFVGGSLGVQSDAMVDEALEVLTTLGVNKTEAYSLVSSVKGEAKTANEIVMKVLQRLDK